jgi:hypothetical protein
MLVAVKGSASVSALRPSVVWPQPKVTIPTCGLDSSQPECSNRIRVPGASGLAARSQRHLVPCQGETPNLSEDESGRNVGALTDLVKSPLK